MGRGSGDAELKSLPRLQTSQTIRGTVSTQHHLVSRQECGVDKLRRPEHHCGKISPSVTPTLATRTAKNNRPVRENSEKRLSQPLKVRNNSLLRLNQRDVAAFVSSISRARRRYLTCTPPPRLTPPRLRTFRCCLKTTQPQARCGLQPAAVSCCANCGVHICLHMNNEKTCNYMSAAPGTHPSHVFKWIPRPPSA